MDNDKAFAVYAIAIFAGLASIITASILNGYAALPTPLMFVEHLAMSLLFRASYKSFGGPAWWPYPAVAEAVDEAVAVPGTVLEGPQGAAFDDDILDAA